MNHAAPETLRDFAVPPACRPPAVSRSSLGIAYGAAAWDPRRLQSLAEHLSSHGVAALASLDRQTLRAAWEDTARAFCDSESAERRGLDSALLASSTLTRTGLQEGLEAVLGGLLGDAADSLWEASPTVVDGFALAVVAGNLPALAAQPLLPSLALGRPMLLKSPSAEPFFAPAFIRALAARLPAVADAVAALTWRGGEDALEAPLLDRAAVVLAYGEEATLDDLERRTRRRFVGYGPKISLAVVGGEVEPAAVVGGLARDVSLFDQRGCLSIHAVYTTGDAAALARALATALAALPIPGRGLDTALAGAVQQIRGSAAMAGTLHAAGDLRAGTVVVEPSAELRPSPGLRTVRVHPLEDLRKLPTILSPWAGRLQGAALAGESAWGLRPALAGLGISRFTPPGELQRADARWHNGGIDPLVALGPG